MCYQLVYWKCALFIYLRYIYLCSLILVQLCCRLFDASSLIWMLASRFFWAFFAADWMPWMQVIIVYHLHKFVLLMLVGWCSGSDQQLELGAFFFWMWMWKGPFSECGCERVLFQTMFEVTALCISHLFCWELIVILIETECEQVFLTMHIVTWMIHLEVTWKTN